MKSAGREAVQGEGLFHWSTEYRELMVLGLPPQCQVPRGLGTFTVPWTPPSSPARGRELRPWAEALGPTAHRDWDCSNPVSGGRPTGAKMGWGQGSRGHSGARSLLGVWEELSGGLGQPREIVW